jgi:hypothetical protein
MAIESETAISLLLTQDQEPLRYIIAKILEKLNHTTDQKFPNNIRAQKEKRTLNEIKEKLNNNNAIITKADKGQSIIIIDKAAYESKILNFLNNNNFRTRYRDPTKKFQKEIRTIINSCPMPLIDVHLTETKRQTNNTEYKQLN